MPELPEVETVRRTLLPLIKGKTIKKVVLWYPKIVENPPEEFIAALKGEQIETIDREAKFLEFRLSNHLTLVSHLRMEGKYRLTVPQEAKDKHDHVEFIFTDGTALRYNDVRKFGRMQLVATGSEKSSTGIGKLGPDALTPGFTTAGFVRALAKKHKNIKNTLLDQTVVSGLGNIYVDEVLWRAKIHPLSLADKIPASRVKNLHKQIQEILQEAISLGGTTVHSYLDANGHAGGFQAKLQVYGHSGEECPRCGHKFDKIKVNGRGTTFCPHCQKEYL